MTPVPSVPVPTAPVLSPRVLVVALGVPVLALAAALIVISSWSPELPDPVATHWGLSGVDGVSPLWTVPILLVGVGLGVPALLVATLAISARSRAFTATHKMLAVTAAAVGVLLAVLVVGSLAIQRGLDDALDAPSIVPAVGLALGVAAVVAVGAWFVLPPTAPVPSTPTPAAAPLDVAAGERVVWLGTASISRGVAALLGVTIVLVSVAVSVAIVASEGALAALLLVPLALLVAFVTTSRFAIRIDRAGLTATGGFGVPRFRVALADIERVSVAQIDPFADFGGIGIRLSIDGRFGIVLRSGEALLVERRGARPFVVTCQDAETAARVLATWLAGGARGDR